MITSSNIGQEAYSDYDALWHLKTLGILDKDNAPIEWVAPASSNRKTRVAMIDTSVATGHPNLKGAVNRKLAFDLFSTRLGAFPYLDPDAKIGPLNLNSGTRVAEGLNETSHLLTQLNDRLSHSAPAQLGGITPTVSQEFSVHGTAIAGLIGARPCLVPTSSGEMKLPYSGVDPYCEIVPISTNFDPDPEQLILAFLYAELINADVILLPRIIPDPFRTLPELSQHTMNGDDLGTLIAPSIISPQEATLWEQLAELIVAISLKRPVVCAAGNSNEEFAIYPANLANEHNGIISVGALNAKGYRSGYSGAGSTTVMAPSNDAEIFDKTEVRLDEQRQNYSPIGVPENNSNFKYSNFEIVSTDVPGRFGYSSSPFIAERSDLELREFGSYFCRFGGTSAASAIVAGFLSLGKTTQELVENADGLVSKNWLLSKCKTVPEDDMTHKVPTWFGDPSFPDRDAHGV